MRVCILGRCVEREECPCYIGDHVFQPGELVENVNCQICTCMDGVLSNCSAPQPGCDVTTTPEQGE